MNVLEDDGCVNLGLRTTDRYWEQKSIKSNLNDIHSYVGHWRKRPPIQKKKKKKNLNQRHFPEKKFNIIIMKGGSWVGDKGKLRLRSFFADRYV